MSLREKINHAYDQVHAPEHVTAHLKQQLSQRGTVPDEMTVPKQAPKSRFTIQINGILVYIAAVLMLCVGASFIWKDLQQYKNPIRPQMAVHTQPPTNPSAGAGDIVMPECVGMQQEQGSVLLQSYGLTVRIQTRSSEASSGIILAQSIPAGQTCAPGTLITLTIAE